MNSFGIDIASFSKNWVWFFLWGLLLLALGIAAIGATTLTTFITVAFLGGLILAGGIIVLIDAFTFWLRKGRGFIIHLLLGLLYSAAGLMLIFHPVAASISLTLLLGIFYIVAGLFRLYYSLSAKFPQWGWVLFSGIISLILGVFILISWPASGLFIIGLFVGIDLIFAGWAYMISALAARAIPRT